MARLTVSTTATATLDGVRREFRANSTSEIGEIVDVEANVDYSDVPATIFTITPGTRTGGSALENFKFLGIKNAGSSVAEIMIKVLQYEDSGSTDPADQYAATSGNFHQNPYLSTLLYPGQHTVFSNPRMVVYNEDIGGTAPESAAFGGRLNNFSQPQKIVTGGTDRGPTDGNGYATSATHWGETDTDGIVPGSYVINFYAAGYQELGITSTSNMKPPVSSSTKTFLAVNTAYAFNIAVNGGGAVTIAFTTHTSDVTLGDPTDSADTGVLRKIQEALDASAQNGVIVSIVDGDIRFTSPSRKASSAIALAAPGSGTTMFGVGILPAIEDVDGAVAGTLEETSSLDANQSIIEGNTDHLMLDNGDGTLSRVNGGTGYVDYDENGTVKLYNCPPNAEFYVTYYYDSAHSGEVTSHATLGNIMYEIYARSVTIGKQAQIKLTAFN